MTPEHDPAPDTTTAQAGIENAGHCEWCGEAFDTGQWHYPGVERTGADELLVYVFCSEHCRAHWEYQGAEHGDDRGANENR